jgi:DNA-directed RNA polymerase specialized sigma24 family protein
VNRKNLAAELKVPETALWSRVHRIRKKLEACLKDCTRTLETG